MGTPQTGISGTPPSVRTPRGQTLTPVWCSMFPWDLPHMPREKPCKMKTIIIQSFSFGKSGLSWSKSLLSTTPKWNLEEPPKEINIYLKAFTLVSLTTPYIVLQALIHYINRTMLSLSMGHVWFTLAVSVNHRLHKYSWTNQWIDTHVTKYLWPQILSTYVPKSWEDIEIND